MVRGAARHRLVSSQIVFLTLPKWNELTSLWNDLSFLWNDLTLLWNDLTWNDLTMERSDCKPIDYSLEGGGGLPLRNCKE